MLKLAQAHLSDEPFTVDGTLIEAWASQKSFRPKDEEPKAGSRDGEVDFHGEHAAIRVRARGCRWYMVR